MTATPADPAPPTRNGANRNGTPKGGVKEAIVAAAAALFQERGFAATSMQEIAAAVGLTRPALYYHYRNKEELLESLVEEVTLKSIRQTLLINAASGDPAATLHMMVLAYANWILARPLHFAVLSREEQKLPEHARHVQRQGRRELLDAYVRVISDGAASGRFRAVDPAVTALSIFGMCNATAQWFKPGGRLTEQQVATSIADLALAMVSRPAIVDGCPNQDPLSCLGVLRNNLEHLERLLTASQR